MQVFQLDRGKGGSRLRASSVLSAHQGKTIFPSSTLLLATTQHNDLQYIERPTLRIPVPVDIVLHAVSAAPRR